MKGLQTVLFPLLMILFAVILRLLPHPANVAPIAAMALFGGVYLNKRYALIVPVIALFLSDIFFGFHTVMPYVYGSFILIGLIGLWLRKHKQVVPLIGATLASSLLFFLITNFGVWAEGMYARDFSGLVQSYVMGLPFFRNTLLGNAFYVGVFFGSFELVKAVLDKNRFVAAQTKK